MERQVTLKLANLIKSRLTEHASCETPARVIGALKGIVLQWRHASLGKED
jgi:hypothetical protein